ncbi:MAG: transcription termination factor NusA [Candidatus Magasanikbacteria bacterium]|nr:transcription termination factor NusA [Candidatus Magasanikbacteria bacterium]
MSSPIMAAMKQIADEKGIKVETVLDAIQQALAAAYRKDFGNKNQNIFVDFDAETGGMKAWDQKVIVPDADLEEIQKLDEEEARLRDEALARGEEPPTEDPNRPRFNPKTEIMIGEAKKLQGGVSIGDELKLPLVIYEEYKDKVGEILQGVVQRREGRNFLIDFGRFSAILPPEEQIVGEFLRPGARVKVYVVSCTLGNRGPEIIVSRSHPNIVRNVFLQEIPEIQNNVVEIKGIAREGGSRSKVAVFSAEEGIDPIGACIGQRGTRIQTIISELGGEKVDIIQWSENPETFISNALSPAKVVESKLDVEQKVALVTVPADQFSLAIGKGGQNVRLAAKLTGWTITVQQTEIEQIIAPEMDVETEQGKTSNEIEALDAANDTSTEVEA